MSEKKKWNIHTRMDGEESVAEIAETLDLRYVTARLLYNRGYRTAEEAEKFIKLGDSLLHDPFLMKDMDKACGRVLEAIERKEKVMVYGDYDVDGMTSTSLMYLYLSEMGCETGYRIPDRISEGYGMNREAVKETAKKGYTLIVTVDTGITAHEEIAYAKELGCDTVVTDHHECGTVLPDSAAVVNPCRPDCDYPFKELAGVGVAFKLVTAVEYMRRERYGISKEGFLSELCRKYIDLVALGTVADVMPLCGENRLIVSMGLRSMTAAPRRGIRVLTEEINGKKKAGGKNITSSTIGFTVAPRINAAGRMGSADTAVRLFLTDSEREASEIARQLCDYNARRQAEENKIINEIDAFIDKEPGAAASRVIVLEGETWHHGVIGIAASRISDRYGKPVILVSFDGCGDTGKGSGRSVKGFDLVDALTYCSGCLERYGGHESAAGLSVTREKLPELKKKLNEYAVIHAGDTDGQSVTEIDCELYEDEICIEQAEELSCLEPCGTANPTPLFVLKNMKLEEKLPIGANSSHTKMILSGSKRFTAVYFGISPDSLAYEIGDEVDIALNLGVNEFLGKRSEQIMVRDIRFSGRRASEAEEDLNTYKKALADGEVGSEYIPDRNDFVNVYKKIKAVLPDGGCICINRLLTAVNRAGSSEVISYVKLRLVLDIFSECGILQVSHEGGGEAGTEIFRITVNQIEGKVRFDESCLYRKLMSLQTANVQK